jgi:hypothetical protein
MPCQWRTVLKDNQAEKIPWEKGNLYFCLCSGLVTELLAYIHTIILMCYNGKSSEKGALSGHVIQLSIKSLTSKFGKWINPIVGLAGTEDWIRATCVAGSGDSRSAIHYDFSIVTRNCVNTGFIEKRQDWFIRTQCSQWSSFALRWLVSLRPRLIIVCTVLKPEMS